MVLGLFQRIFQLLAVTMSKQGFVFCRNSGPREACSRLLAQLPLPCQSYTSSPYVDMSLYQYDTSLISNTERVKTKSDEPIRQVVEVLGFLAAESMSIFAVSTPVKPARCDLHCICRDLLLVGEVSDSSRTFFTQLIH